jgi:hypothetical protein
MTQFVPDSVDALSLAPRCGILQSVKAAGENVTSKILLCVGTNLPSAPLNCEDT